MKLPIHEVEAKLLGDFGAGTPWRVLVKAPTGSGKSTGLPSMLLDAGIDGKIIVVQPRRIAARMLARRVASLRGTRLGDEVGYIVRFDNKTSPASRIIYITDGILQRWLEDNPLLEGIGAIIFDEFHERRLAMDIALADCLTLQESHRPKLKVCVMSATLELAGLEDYLDPCRLIEAGGRSYPVEISYQHALPKSKTTNRYGNGEEPIWEKCARAVTEAVIDPACGNILVFLPGVYEIQKTITLLEQKKLTSSNAKNGGWEICPLYGALKPEQQDRAVRDGGPPRIIVSTNVAETSLTIPGVCTVIDAGLARISEFDPLRGMNTLFIKKISRAAADQRAGRAGRVAPGRCIRLWSQPDHARRAEFELPEVRRIDITETALKLKSRGITDLSTFRWLDQPTAAGHQHALHLLENLEAIESAESTNLGKITALGKSMATMPLHPREARLLIAAQQENCLPEAIFTIALMQTDSGGIFMKGKQHNGRSQFIYEEDTTDFAADHRAYISAAAMQFTPQRCTAIGVLARIAREVQQSVQQLEKTTSRMGWDVSNKTADFSHNAEPFSRAMLTAYSDRLAVRTGAGNLSCRITGGRSGKISPDSAVKDSQLFLVTSMTEVGARDITVHLSGCTEVLLETVRELRGKFLQEGNQAVYDEKIRRVVNRQQTTYQDLIITTKDTGDKDIDPDQAAALLAERVANGELKLKKWDAGVEQWIARLLSLRDWMPELELPGFDEEDRSIALETICQGALGYKQIKDKEVMPALQGWLSAGQHAALEAYAPTRLKLSNGEHVKVKYELGKPPSIALTVQRLYGIKTSPTIANGTVTIQTHICAPNQRPWQMTQDLENFWKSGFDQMKKDLAGRYPKHNWTGVTKPPRPKGPPQKK
tara:strand:+ start:12470 stop:15112 length:2643 start_codon:yes stop_codon:yes gene_type:complete